MISMVEIFDALVASAISMSSVLIGLIIFIIVGYIFGILAKILISKVLGVMGVDEWFEQQSLLAAIGNKNFSDVIGSIAKWYIFFIFLKQSVELVNLVTLNEVLGFWIQYALLLIVAIGVVIAGLIIGRFVRNAIETTTHSLKRIFGLVLELMIVYIAVVMAISILGLPTMLLEFAFLISLTGFVLSMSIMVGIGFGFALKDEAKSIIKEFKKPTKK
ncbi:MAG: hypothetical protein PHX27_01760 [Candidatus ainarchaeum sp.]|nr:hypothetical protein [Candidatus ainarchaeum sp.]